jgi:hypothetical protein
MDDNVGYIGVMQYNVHNMLKPMQMMPRQGEPL